MICNGKFVRFSYFIRYFHNCISRISLLTFCILNYKCNFVCRLFLSIPQTSWSRLWTTVQIIFIIVFLKLIGNSIDHNFRICNTIAVSSNNCSKTGHLLLISLCIFITKDHICIFSVLIFYHKWYNGCSKICNLCIHPLRIGNSIKCCLFSICKLSKCFSFHNCNCLLNSSTLFLSI